MMFTFDLCLIQDTTDGHVVLDMVTKGERHSLVDQCSFICCFVSFRAYTKANAAQVSGVFKTNRINPGLRLELGLGSENCVKFKSHFRSLVLKKYRKKRGRNNDNHC